MNIDQLARQYRNLRETLAHLGREDGSPDWDAMVEPVAEQMADISRRIAICRARNHNELILKAGILLEWTDPQATDIPAMLVASLCRDLLILPSGSSGEGPDAASRPKPI